MKKYGIIGTSFCGSTLFSFILNGNDRVFSTGELNHLKRMKYNTFCSIHRQQCTFWTEAFISKCVKNLKIRHNLVAQRAKQLLNKDIIIYSDKSPYVYQRAIENNINFDGFIVLFKKPEGLYYSYYIHGKNSNPKTPFTKSLNKYHTVYKYYFNHLCTNNDLLIFYDDLATNPSSIIKQACKYLGIKYDKIMLDFWRPIHHTLSGNTATTIHVRPIEDREKILQANYWKKSFSNEHIKDVTKYYRQIRLDDKWKRGLTQTQKNKIKQHRAYNIFKELMDKRIKP